MENKKQNNKNDSRDCITKSNKNLDYKIRFKNVFEFSPISLWEEDLSLVFEGLEKIRSEGVSDLKTLLLSDHDLVETLIKKIEILNVNNATLDLLEADSKDELIGSFAKFFDKANLDLFISELLSIWNKDEVFSADYRALSLKGNPLFTQLQFKIPQEPSESKNVFISILDLTKLKNVEKRLLSEQEIYRTIFTLAPSGIVIEDKHGNIIDANDAQHISLGYGNGELIGKNVRDISSIENKFYVDENISKLLNGEILIHELESLKKDGSRCINALRETRISLPNGEYGILNFSTDVTEKRKLEESLKKREEIFSSLFNLSSEILIVTDLNEGKVPTLVFVNDSAIEAYGYSRKEMIGKPISIFISEMEKVKERTIDLYNGQTIKFETVHYRKNGTQFPVNVIAKLITLFGKKHIYSIARDISLEKEQEKKQKQRIKFLKATNEISEIILSENEVYHLLSRVINMIGKTLELDRAFIYKVDLKNGIGKMLTVWNNPETEDLVPAENNYSVSAFAKGLEYSLAQKDILESYFDKIHPAFVGEPSSILHEKLKIKTLLWLPFSFSVDGFLLLALNQTQYRRVFNENEKEFIRSTAQQINLSIMKIGFLDKALKDESELKKLSQAVEQSPAVVIITNTDGEIEYVNAKFTEATGYTLDEVKGKTPRILKSGYTSSEEYKNLWDTISAGKTWRGEFRNKKKNGELFWEAAVISSIKDEKGKILHYLGIKEVVTEKKKLVEELKKSKIKAEQNSQLKSVFLSQMSHEIRTPVNTMISFAGLLKDDLEDQVSADLSKSFDGIDRAGQRIIRTTELLLDLSEIQTNTYEPSFKMIELNIEILGPLVLAYKDKAAEQKLKFNYRIKSEEAVITGDLETVEKIFKHLIENAIKFTIKGTIGLKVYKDNKNLVVCEISDTGIGISEEFLPKLFSPFSQEDMGYSRRYDGNGIGLALVNEYCKLNNITIEVKTKKGEGTTFLLTFLNAG